ncbi:uncharacterized protein AMSG_10921 [Thecamonas trahens ATCC 50062]|uniref:Uncharacterized protein n=1 Tax=Thecamonas trahens ATCC 50062 TaxID=461836 RepID=A0A0L0DTA7_THETB|nr:hypothetical protein AMSG_10921 [Thecamonas trahens ATCC 50062]KNC55281.1 hypothetical protein AMSG_10921 [Thecamonas trahens ATCC 50062]|eukprot:XP_013753103.1 hypothetical protein AMSG_10921 [Thecamonas trahens ATCC 50062]
MAVADFTGDGCPDVVVSYHSFVKAYKCTDGKGGAFAHYETLTSSVSHAADIAAGHIDNNGYIDVATVSKNNADVIYFLNHGTFFGSQVVLKSTAEAIHAVAFGRMNNDGYDDLVVADRHYIHWFARQAGGGYVTGTETVVSYIVDVYFGRIATGHMNADSYTDVVSASYGHDNIDIHLSNNAAGSSFTTSYVTSSLNTNDLVLADLDQDGINDIIYVSPTLGRLGVLINSGVATFSHHTITSSLASARGVSVTDWNHDGIPDILAGSSSHLKVFLNSGSGTAYTSHPIDGTTSSVRDVGVFPVNDGLIAVAALDNRPYFTDIYTDIGKFGAGTQIDSGLGDPGPRATAIADLDSDGDGDIVAAMAGGSLVWYRNDNEDGTFTAAITVDASTPSGPRSLAVADLDADGALDIVLVTDSGTLGWYRNTNGMGSFAAHALLTSPTSPTHVVACDLNADGFVDLAYSHASGASWLASTGPASFATPASISTDAPGIWLACADADGDGAHDLATLGDDDLAYHHNDGGTGTFSSSIVATGLTSPVCVTFADLDNANRLDLAVSTDPPGVVNSVLRTFTSTSPAAATYSEVVLASDLAYAGQVVAMDVDHDGRDDIVASDSYAAFVFITPLTSSSDVFRNANSRPHVLATGDLDSDGDDDLVVGTVATGILRTFPVISRHSQIQAQLAARNIAPPPGHSDRSSRAISDLVAKSSRCVTDTVLIPTGTYACPTFHPLITWPVNIAPVTPGGVTIDCANQSSDGVVLKAAPSPVTGSPLRGVVTVNDIDVVNSGSSGGLPAFAVSGTGAALTISNAAISEAAVGGSGGAVVVDDGGVLVVTNTSFTNCEAGGSGGAIYGTPSAGSVTISSVTLSGNTAGAGGAIAWTSPAALAMDSASTCNANKATAGNGGCLLVSTPSPDLSLSGVTVSNNSAAGSGGGLAVHRPTGAGGGSVAITSGTMFNDNVAAVDGGALAVSVAPGASAPASLSLSGVTAMGGSAGRAGGVVAIASRPGAAWATTITSSTFTSPNASIGGGLACAHPDYALSGPYAVSSFPTAAPASGATIACDGLTISTATALFGGGVFEADCSLSASANKLTLLSCSAQVAGAEGFAAEFASASFPVTGPDSPHSSTLIQPESYGPAWATPPVSAAFTSDFSGTVHASGVELGLDMAMTALDGYGQTVADPGMVVELTTPDFATASPLPATLVGTNSSGAVDLSTMAVFLNTDNLSAGIKTIDISVGTLMLSTTLEITLSC